MEIQAFPDLLQRAIFNIILVEKILKAAYAGSKLSVT